MPLKHSRYTSEEDDYIRNNYLSKSNEEIAQELGRTVGSIHGRLKFLNLRRGKKLVVGERGAKRDGYKYVNYSSWRTRIDTPCCLLIPCQVCDELLPALDYYVMESASSGTEDVLGIRRHRKCVNCNNKDYLTKDTSTKLIQGALQRARKDGRECNLRPEDIRIPELCPILGIKMFEAIGEGKKGGSWNDNAPSLDRNDNSKGYVRENVRVISKKANILKRDGSIDDFLSLLAYLVDIELGEDVYGDDFVPYAKRTVHERIDIILKYRKFNQEAGQVKSIVDCIEDYE
jgi:hypothetical protein